MGIGDIAVSLWGECEAQAGMHFSGRGFVHVELIDPETGAPLPLEDGAEGELVYTHLTPPRRAAAALPQPRPRAASPPAPAPAAAPRRGCAASAAPTTC